MTTVLADSYLGVMTSDSQYSGGGQKWLNVPKIFRVPEGLIGFSGAVAPALKAIELIRAEGMDAKLDEERAFDLMLLRKDGLYIKLSGELEWYKSHRDYDAIGSGATAALAAYEALDFDDPVRAVKIASNHDLATGGKIVKVKL